jgi:hypothetical protein
MESHALHGDGLYYESGDRLWVNLYVPSTATWQAAGVDLTMKTTFPEGEAASLSFTAKTPRTSTLALRRPYWAGNGFGVKVNGVAVPKLPPPGTYVELKRVWKTGDTIDLVLPKTLSLEPLADNAGRAALMWGPLVLAGDLGPVQRRGRGTAGTPPAPAPTIPVFVTEKRSPTVWLKPVEGAPGRFRTDGVGRDRDVEFQPFYTLHRRTYGAYWDIFTPSGWQMREAAVRAGEAKRRQLEAATVAFVQPGQMQTERDFNQQGGNSTPIQLQGRYGRRATDWFSFDVPVDPAHPALLVVTYNREERANRAFEVLVDGVRIGEQAVPRRSPEQLEGFFEVEYPVPANLVAGKQKVTVRFQGTGGSEVAAIYGIRMVRAAQVR